ncbi:MAG: hypothetical protein JXA67_18700 [Micromonosporaceae bacterium]|nr:hypothetical protein [Micromonosporaceae bacterium]
MALVTNTSAETPLLWAGTALAPWFDHVVFSCQIGWRNQTPAPTHQAALDALRRPAAGSVFVGDGAGGELAGAHHVGLAPIQITCQADGDQPTTPWPGTCFQNLVHLPDHLDTLGA